MTIAELMDSTPLDLVLLMIGPPVLSGGPPHPGR